MSLQLSTTFNVIDGSTTAASETLIMPTADTDGNPLSDGITCGISFGVAVTALTLSGSFRTAAPTSASAGQVMNFRYSANTGSWWNA
jgi:hypothetical protein